MLLKTYFLQSLCSKSGLRTVLNWQQNPENAPIFWRCFGSLVKFSYWSKFHVNIITDSAVMTISFYEGLTKNLEIGNAPVWVLSNIWRLGQVRNAKFGMMVSNIMLLNAAKFQDYNFYRSWVIKGKPTGTGKGIKLLPDPPPGLRLRF